MSAPSAGPSLRAALALALGQLVLGLVLGAFHRIGSFDAEADFYLWYAPGARALAAGEPYEPTHSGPGFSALLALLAWLGADLFSAAKACAAVSLSFLGLATYAVAKRLAGAPIALLAQGLVYLVLLRRSFVASNDVVAVMLIWAALALPCLFGARSASALFLAGVLAGLSFVTRYSGAVLFVALPLALLSEESSWRRRARAAAAFAAGGLLLVLPLLALNLKWFGRPMNHASHAILALDVFGDPAHRLDGGELARMEERFGSLGEVLAHDPPRLVARYAHDLVADLAQGLQDLLPFPVLLLVGVGAVMLLRREPAAPRWLVVLLVAFTALAAASAVPVAYQTRYYFPVLPVLATCVAAGMLEPWGKDARALRGLRRGVAAAALLVLAAGSLWKTHESLSSDPVELLGTAQAARPLVRPGDGLVVRKPQLAYLTGTRSLQLPTGDVEEVLARARANGARFLYVGPREVRQNPALAALVTAATPPAGLALVHEHASPPGRLFRFE
jgi:4-amino-4-deoxy-L-arabinose transferase-like glycosyltransferase